MSGLVDDDTFNCLLQVLWQVDAVLFCLLILSGLSDSQGRVWRCHPNQLYVVEVTLPNRDNIPECDKNIFPEKKTISLLDLLPSVSCLSPQNVLKHLNSSSQGMVCIGVYM